MIIRKGNTKLLKGENQLLALGDTIDPPSALVCGAPTNLQVSSIGQTSVVASWDSGPSNATSTTETLQIRQIGGSWSAASGSGNPRTITGLTAYQTYEIQVVSNCYFELDPPGPIGDEELFAISNVVVFQTLDTDANFRIDNNMAWSVDGMEVPDVSLAGYTGGIPDDGDIPIVATASGFTDVAVRAAIASAAANAATGLRGVFMPNGLYTFASPVEITDDRIVIIGESRAGTIVRLLQGNPDTGAFSFKGGGTKNPDREPANNNTDRSENLITLNGTVDHLAVNDYVLVKVTDQPAALDDHYSLGTPSEAYSYQIFKLTQVTTGTNTIRFDRPSIVDIHASDNCSIRKIEVIKNVGVLNLTIDCRGANPGPKVDGINCYYVVEFFCRNVSILKPNQFPIGWFNCRNVELRDVLFNDAWDKGGGGTGYGGFFRCFYGVMEGSQMYNLRHAFNFQRWAHRNVISNCYIEGSDAQWHTRWTAENIVELTTIEMGTKQESYIVRSTPIENPNAFHDPQSDRNVLWNCRINGSNTGGGILLGGLGKKWVIAYNVLYSVCQRKNTRDTSFLLAVMDFQSAWVKGNKFTTDGAGYGSQFTDGPVGVLFFPGYDTTTQTQTGVGTARGLVPPIPGTTTSAPATAISSTAAISLINNTFYGIDPSMQVVGPGTLTVDTGNTWNSSYTPMSSLFTSAPIGSLWAWQKQQLLN